jgi:threonine dehydratase
MAAREATAAQIALQTGATFIPPYDYGPVIAGQGTIALELLQQVGSRKCVGCLHTNKQAQ